MVISSLWKQRWAKQHWAVALKKKMKTLMCVCLKGTYRIFFFRKTIYFGQENTREQWKKLHINLIRIQDINVCLPKGDVSIFFFFSERKEYISGRMTRENNERNICIQTWCEFTTLVCVCLKGIYRIFFERRNEYISDRRTHENNEKVFAYKSDPNWRH